MATFGYTSDGGYWSEGNAADAKRGSKFTLSKDGYVSKLTAYMSGAGNTGNQVVKGMIYADSSGSPGALKGVTAEVTVPQNARAGWVDLTFASPVSLAAGDYWLGTISGATAGNIKYAYLSGSGSAVTGTDTYSDGPSDPCGSVTSSSNQVSIYATYTPPPVTLSPSGVASAEAVGSPALGFTLSPVGIASTTAFGSPLIEPQTVLPQGIASTEVVGAPTLATGPVTVAPAGIISGTAFGIAALRNVIRPSGISSLWLPASTALGTPAVDPVLRDITPAGIAAAGAFGTPAIAPGAVDIAPAGLTPSVAFGTAQVERVAIPPAERDFIRVLDASGNLVGILPAQVRWTLRLLGACTLDSVTVPWEYLKADGTLESRMAQIETGWYCLWQGRRYIIEEPDTDNETGITFTGRSAETELSNYFTNYSPGPATFLNMLPSAIYAQLLAGRAGRTVKNAGFGILDASNLPTNWSHPTGWTSQLVSNRRVWQADAGSEESYSDDLPCTPGISYRVKVDVCAANATGTRGVKLRWIKADGTITDSAAVPLATENGAFHTVDTGDLMALGTRLRIVLYTSGTAGTTQFDDVRLLEAGPDTGWTNVGTAMDTRLAAIPYNDGAIQKYGVWTEAGAPANRIESTAAGDYVARVINGAFVTIHFAAGGVGARAKIRVNGVVIQAALDVSSATTYTVSGLDPANDHIVEVEVAAGKVSFLGLTVSTENLISMRWDWKTVYEAVVSIREAVGGELEFNTVNKTITHKASVGQDLAANNVLDFRRGSNIVKMDRTEDRSKLINQLTGLGYGEGLYQLVVTVDDTTTDDSGDTSQDVYGIQRGIYEDKACLSLATMTATLQRMVAQSAWYRNAYQVQVTALAAALCVPGDTGHFVYDAINESLRILEITRSTESSTATFKVANIAEDLTYKLEATRKDLATLQKSYQGVPSDANDSFSEQFERTSGGTDTPATVDFFVPYGADLLDLRLRYQVGGLRAYAKAVGGGGGTNTPSGGGSTSGSGGSTSPTSSSESTPSGGGATSGSTGAPSGGGSTSGGTAATAGAVASPTRSPAVSSVYYEVLMPQTNEMVDPTGEVGVLCVGNFSGGTRSFSWQLRTAANGGGTGVLTGTFSDVADGAFAFDVLSFDGSYGHTDFWLRVQMTTAGDGSWLFTGTRTASFAHTHTTPDHTHPDHTHSTPAHTHPAHSHTVTVPAHTHTTPDHAHALPDHAHTLSYGIYESSTPATVRLYLDGALITALNDSKYVSDFDLLPYVTKDSNGRVAEGWHTLEWKSATAGATGRVRGTVFARKFISTEAA